MTHQQLWSSSTPGLLVILLDQSTPMLELFNDNEIYLDRATKIVNLIIDECIQVTFNGAIPKNRCFITVIGYNQRAKELCSGFLTDLNDNPIRIDDVKQKVADGAGGFVETTKKMPIWVDSINDGGETNMPEAFSYAKELVSQWIKDKPNNPAPVIINISRGVLACEGKVLSQCKKEIYDKVSEIHELKSHDGEPLIFNIGLTTEKNVIQLPIDKQDISSMGESAEFLYDISSPLWGWYEYNARKNEFSSDDDKNRIGLVWNDGVFFISILPWGRPMAAQLN